MFIFPRVALVTLGFDTKCRWHLRANPILHQALDHAIGCPLPVYANDFLILAKIKEEAQEAMSKVEEFLECHLRLLVNQDKSQIAPLKECSFLGFRIHGKKVQRTDKAAQLFKMRIREITSLSRGVSLPTLFIEKASFGGSQQILT